MADALASAALSLRAYLAYARKPTLPGEAASGWHRPQGPVVWAVTDTADTARALVQLGGRIKAQQPRITLVLSGMEPPDPDPATVALRLPTDSLPAADAFAEALRPDVVLWATHSVAPALLHALRRTSRLMLALNAREAPWSSPAPRWLPDPAPATLSLFDRIYCTNEAAFRHLRRLNVPHDRLQTAGPLIDAGPPLDCAEAMHEEAAQLLAGRPIWLAAHVQPEEAGDLLRAHRRAVRMAHRLMLVLVPAGPAEAASIRAIAEASQMRLCLWDGGHLPDDNTQVLLTEGPEDLGLWYRLAPLTFLGSSLVSGYGGVDPFPAAALGAAVLYGPNVGRHLAAYSQLVDAGGARIVRDAESLAAAVSHLIAPDQSAAMAHAGWDVVTSGARLVDDLVETISTALDSAGHA